NQGGELVLAVTPFFTLTLPIICLTNVPEDERENEAKRLAQQEMRRPFDLAQGPLLRVLLIRSADEVHYVLLMMHHIISDGWSIDVFMHELAVLYNAFVQGIPPSLPELPIQYADYAYWQQQWLQSDVLAAQLAYWTKQLDGIVPLELPTDHPRPA